MELYGEVEDRVGLDVSGEDLVHAVLGTLGEHLPVDAAEALAASLPEELQDLVLAGAESETWDHQAFLEDLAAALEVDTEKAERSAVEVLAVVRRSLGDDELFLDSLPASLRRRIDRS